jgi:hypothetical protein
VNGAGSVDIDVHGLHDDTVESEQQGTTSLGHARAFASGCVKNTQFTRARAPNQSPTRSGSVTPDPHQIGRAFILLSGAHVDPDTLDVLRDVFPAANIAMVFGSTMILSQAQTRTDGETFVFDPRSPYVFFWVVDPDTGEQVGYGERGQVVMNHISKGMFIPNNLERDTAIRLLGPEGQIGDSVAEVAPVAVLDGEPVIEGVY